MCQISNQYYASIEVVFYSRYVYSGLELFENPIDALIWYPHNKLDEN